MRVAMIGQWARAARSDPEHRQTAIRFVVGIGLVQVCWLLRLLLPHDLAFAVFFVLVVAELAVPLWAERAGMTPWHPHHIAERYGLFTIIVLGECVLAANVALQVVVEDTGWDADLLLVGGGGLVLLFALWWMYFLKEAGAGLARRRELGVLVGLRPLRGVRRAGRARCRAGGGGRGGQPPRRPHRTVWSGSPSRVPVAVYLVVVWLLHAPLGEGYRRSAVPIALATAATLGAAALVPLGLPVPWLVVLVAVPPCVLVATHLDRTGDLASGPGIGPRSTHSRGVLAGRRPRELADGARRPFHVRRTGQLGYVDQPAGQRGAEHVAVPAADEHGGRCRGGHRERHRLARRQSAPASRAAAAASATVETARQGSAELLGELGAGRHGVVGADDVGAERARCGPRRSARATICSTTADLASAYCCTNSQVCRARPRLVRS